VTTVIQCDNGDYLNVSSVYRWSVTEDVTRDGHMVQAHIHGPQRPFLVCTRTSEEGARHALKAILELSCHVIPGGRSTAEAEPAFPRETARQAGG
jgi:hypothetical protein